MSVRIVLFSALLCTVCCLTTSSAETPPNVVVILTDDQGWGDLSIHGNQNIDTPHLDRLARDGAQFDSFYVCPVCSPTRAEFLTGRYHTRSGVVSTSSGGERLALDETTIADSFQAAGYRTAAFGKWHNGTQYPYHPLGRGFDEYYGFTSGHWGHYFSPMLDRNGEIVQGKGYLTDDFTDKAIEFIAANRQRPFFCYLAYNTPHSPMQVPDRWWDKYKDKPMVEQSGDNTSAHSRAALAMCENIDWNVGRLLEALEEQKLARNTIVVYFGDNGPNGPRYNGGMRGHKGSTDEGGVRSPLFIRWPDRIAAGRSIPQISAAIDLLPTLADLCGVEPVGDKPLDGRSLAPLLLKDDPEWPQRLLFSHWAGRVSVRSQRFRLDPQGRLYDIEQDRGQRNNVAAKHPDETARLKQAGREWIQETGGMDARQWPFVVGHPEFDLTQLPARDAVPHGGIERSNRHPNCTFLTNWTTTDDAITWEVEVPADGKFAVEVYYTCPEGDTGATVELSFAEAQVSGRVTAPHDPPLVGAEQDRSPRQEGLVKDFRPLKLGTIELKKGRGTLTLQAMDIPRGNVMDFRLLTLRRK